MTFELWRSHIRQVEGHFGTAVASYFVLLRWLFYMNMAIFAVWTLFVLVPQFVLERPVKKTNSCVFSNASGYAYRCPRRSSAAYLTNCASPNVTNTTLCTNESISVMVAPKRPVCSSDGGGGGGSGGSAYLLGVGEVWSLCPSPQPVQFIDLVTGRGALSDTWLFLGHYSNLTRYYGISYNRPVAILICSGVVYTISFIMLIIRY